MKLYVKAPGQGKYHRQSCNYPRLPRKSEVKPGDTLYSLSADYYVDKVEYSKSNLTVYATKTQILVNRRN